jgi:hypothetical protein
MNKLLLVLGTCLFLSVVAGGCGGCGGENANEVEGTPEATATVVAVPSSSPAFAEPTAQQGATETPGSRLSHFNVQPQCDIPEEQRAYIGEVVNKEDVLDLVTAQYKGAAVVYMNVREGSAILSPSQVSPTFVTSHSSQNGPLGVSLRYGDRQQVQIAFVGELDASLSEGTAPPGARVGTASLGEVDAEVPYNVAVLAMKVVVNQGSSPYIDMCSTPEGVLYTPASLVSP